MGPPAGIDPRVRDLIEAVEDKDLACEGLALLARRGRGEAAPAADDLVRRVGFTNCVQAAMAALVQTRRPDALRVLLAWLESPDTQTRMAVRRFYLEHVMYGYGEPDLLAEERIREELQTSDPQFDSIGIARSE